MQVLRFDAFSNIPGKGNPAGIVLDADGISDSEMQKISAAVGFNETAFICTSNCADIQIRFFTPGYETNLCGHATIASLAALYNETKHSNIRTVETKAGIIDVGVSVSPKDEVLIQMEQIPAQFIAFNGDIDQLASVIGIDLEDIDLNLPVVYGNTGVWTLIVPIVSLKVFERMKPQNDLFPDVLSQVPKASIHTICMETYNSIANIHGRHFSSPFSGTIEDSVTGTASGVMGAYILRYFSKQDSISLIVEQGQEIGKNGFITVHAEKINDTIEVGIEGTAVFVERLCVNI